MTNFVAKSKLDAAEAEIKRLKEALAYALAALERPRGSVDPERLEIYRTVLNGPRP